MKRTLIIAVITAGFAMTSSAFATQPGGCKKNCQPDPTQPTPTVPTTNNSNANVNSNTNANHNMMAQGQLQGQMQGQAQVQGINNSGNSSSTATVGSSMSVNNQDNFGNSASIAHNQQENMGNSTASASAGSSSSAVNNAGNSTVTANMGGNTQTNEGNNSKQNTVVNVGGDHYEAPKIPVATAYAAPLTAANGTCMGSSSAGGQGVGFGLSFGTTWTDSDCDRRYDAQELRAQGHTKAATALLCQKASIREAMKAAGTPCPQDDSRKVATSEGLRATVEPTMHEKAVQYTGDDPIIRQRLGLPPLAKVVR